MLAQLTPEGILGIIGLYFAILIYISWRTSRNASNEDFFIAGRQSPWPLVAFGMIGASLSGVTFISVPGAVGAEGLNRDFSYLQMVLGYTLGYAFIALVLLPLYYRLQLTSIYTYLGQRFGKVSYKTGAAFFLLSRTIGAAFRLYLVAIVLQKFVMDHYGIPFWATVLVTIVLIWIYTYRGGIKTIVWTDTLQTASMLIAVIATIWAIGNALEKDLFGLIDMVHNSGYAKVFFFEGGWQDPNNFFKQFFSGALITIVMTGLDQDMMQKNLSCHNLRDAQKNMFSFTLTLVLVNVLFLMLGALLYLYAANIGLSIPERSDHLFPTIALNHLSPIIGIFFVLGLIAAAYSSADSALTALTTSFCVDFLGFDADEHHSEAAQQRLRWFVHIGFSLLLLVVIIAFNALNNDAVINQLFRAASYTYGPLLGLFMFGMLTPWKVRDRFVWVVCLLAPAVSYYIDTYSAQLMNGFRFGFLTLALNGMLTFAGLWLLSYTPADTNDDHIT